MAAVFKIPRGWRPSLADRTALYPALHLRWSGERVTVSGAPPSGAWSAAGLRVLVADGPLDEADRDLIRVAFERGLPVLLAAQAPLAPADRAFAARHGCVFVGWSDPGPLASPPPARPDERWLQVTGLAARRAEDLILDEELDLGSGPGTPPPPGRRIVAVAEDAQSLQGVWPALAPALADGVQLFVVFEREGEPAPPGAFAVAPQDPGLLALLEGAEAMLCLFPAAAPDDPRPAQWARTALFTGAPVIAASHPSLDGLAHLCVLDDIERGLRLYARFPAERLKAAAIAAAELAPRLEPPAVAGEWLAAAAPAPAPEGARPPPTLLALIDIHQDLDVLLPVLLALRDRGEVQLQLVVSDYLLADSPRIPASLEAHGLAFAAHPREAIRAGSEPRLAGVQGVLSGADTSTRAHKAGHTLAVRARAAGLPSFTLQHGLENIGLTYKDHLHGEEIRFASDTVFIWGAPEGLAPWVPEETRAKVIPVGAPKAPALPAAAPELQLGHWERIVGVFENLHWHRFSELYLERCLEDLAAAAEARPETLFLVKPHHAGRWLSRRPERLQPRPNLLVIDPTDSAWEPHTAPALIAGVERVLTTPSTVALDAARSGRPVAVLGYDLELPLYEPLPIVRRREDLDAFLEAPAAGALRLNEAFLKRTILPGRADHRIAVAIARRLNEAAAVRPRKRRWLGG